MDVRIVRQEADLSSEALFQADASEVDPFTPCLTLHEQACPVERNCLDILSDRDFKDGVLAAVTLLEGVELVFSFKVRRNGIFKMIVPRLTFELEIAFPIRSAPPDDFPVVLPDYVFRILVNENLRFAAVEVGILLENPLDPADINSLDITLPGESRRESSRLTHAHENRFHPDGSISDV